MSQPSTLLFKHILRKIFIEDWVMKLVALAITLALWLGVTGLSKPTTQRLTSIPLSIRYSNNIEVTNSPIQEVNLVVSGDSRRLAQVIENDLVASIDVSDVTPGDKVIPLTPETVAVSLPTGVKLDEVQPRSMAVRIETVEEKDVAVEAEISGDLPAGYELYGQTVTPAKVRVRGPSGFLRTLETVRTEPINISDRNSDFTLRQLPVVLANPKAAILTESVVDVALRIGEKRIERVYSVPLDDDSGRRAQVTLFGGQSLFEDIRPTDLRVEVDENSNGEGRPRLILPPSLEGKVTVVGNIRIRG
jgi:YbbR domain-containing protein